jgi:chromosome segregation protein
MYSTSIQVGELRIAEGRKTVASLDNDITRLQDELMANYNEVSSLEARKTELDERRKYIVQTGDSEAKARELRELLETARVEYDDRKERLDSLNNEMRLLSEQLSSCAQRIADSMAAYERESNMLRNLENRKNVLDQLIASPFNNQAGIRSVMESRIALRGILGVVGQVFEVENGYEEAVATALGGAMNNIVTADEQCARDAIRFLNRNQSGRATFLPLTVMQPRWVAKEARIICDNTKGFLGVASDFVSNDPVFDPVAQGLLANVLVVDTMETGNELSSLTKRMYKIVTLNGEVIHRGGSMTGGKTRHDTNLVTMKKEASQIAQQIDSQKARVDLARRNYDSASSDREIISRRMSERRVAAAALEPVVEAKQAKYEKLRNDYSLLKKDDEEDLADAHADELVIKLNTAYSRRDEITAEIRTKREQRQAQSQDNDRKEAQLKQVRKDLDTANASANAIRIDQSRIETRMENSLQRLTSEYQLTYEFAKTKVTGEPVENAKEEVAALRADIERLGNINMNAPEEYTEVNERYEALKANIEELNAARDKILAAIDEMDTVMKKQFREMFNKINVEFNEIFRTLYGGGKASLILEDPSDILNTGIDIDAQPPGKAVTNNKLFSGGEKSLIALCVLFAILKVKPVPLVILDEVEAALDPGNVERFAQYLHNYTDRTQFIVVTHRPGTMENTDVLFGVTMQHQGVSQMLKVELREAIDMAEPTVLEAVS